MLKRFLLSGRTGFYLAVLEEGDVAAGDPIIPVRRDEDAIELSRWHPHSQGVRSLRLRQTRSIGLRKTALQHLLTAAAINLIRLDDFLIGVETERTRISRFAALAPKEAA
jgi:Transposase DDE domain